MGLRERLKRLERVARGRMVAIPQRDGSVERFPEGPNGYELYAEVLVHEADRRRRHYDGLEPGEAHPFVDALRDAAPGAVERVAPTHMYRHWLDEDEVYRGERERSGPQVRVTRPGLYE